MTKRTYLEISKIINNVVLLKSKIIETRIHTSNREFECTWTSLAKGKQTEFSIKINTRKQKVRESK
jgi:hypothetical protein